MTVIFEYVERSKLSIKYAIFSSMREMPFYYNFPKRKLASQVESPLPLKYGRRGINEICVEGQRIQPLGSICLCTLNKNLIPSASKFTEQY